MEEELTIEEEVEMSPLLQEIAQKPNLIGSNPLCPGCGALIGLKIALQIIGKCVVVNAPGCISSLAKYLSVPFLIVKNPAAAAASISKQLPVLVFAGDCATKSCLQTLMRMKQRNFIYICYNNHGCCKTGKRIFQRDVAKSVPSVYSATASLSEPVDYIKKIKKAMTKDGLKFIELFAPCPELWKFDSSNTIEVARLAVETGLWPLYERDGKLSFTKRLIKLEPMKRYFSILNVKITDDEINKLEQRAKNNLHIK